MSISLVIVESPAKAKTISKFLGDDFIVEASIGHIRDLPRNAAEIPEKLKKEAWAKKGIDIENDFTPLYIIPSEKKEQVRRLRAALKKADCLYLATDEDREGESISWHLLEILKPKVPVHRLVFHEITKKAIHGALKNVRSIDDDLVRAQETRRLVDRLYGYDVSPLLWKKLHKQKLSAGRVQSVALRLVVEREQERKRFVSADWWSIKADLHHEKGDFQAGLIAWKENKLASSASFDRNGQLKNSTLTVLDEKLATTIVDSVQGKAARVLELEEKTFSEKPPPPFITSTLQQEAIRKLRWTAKQTMSVAQRLYENGWITYMRTDSVVLSSQAVSAARSWVAKEYGEQYIPQNPRMYRSSSKNAQEAHEAIRPAGEAFKSIAQAQRELGGQEAKLYELIWKRTIASQMKNAMGNKVRAILECGDARFSANGKSYTFQGFRKAYVEGALSSVKQDKILPPLVQGDEADITNLLSDGHRTQPPARYNEASLVRALEERGIGRPSTYASIIDNILSRGYIFKKSSALIPTFTAFVVISLLQRYLGWLIDYEFTAKMEQTLDRIAAGDESSLACLTRFYLGKEGLKETLVSAETEITPQNTGVILGETEEGENVEIRCGRYGEYIQVGEHFASIPEQLPPDELTLDKAISLIEEKKRGPKELGEDPETSKTVYLAIGPYGYYVQLGVPEEVPKKRGTGMKTINPKRVSLLKNMDPTTVELSIALKLLSLPRTLGIVTEEEEEKKVIAATGPYGPYLKKGKSNMSLPKGVSPLEVTLEQALELFAKQPPKSRSLGTKEGVDIMMKRGRFGPYITDGTINAPIPRSVDSQALTLEDAWTLLQEKKAKGPAKKKGKKATKKKATKKTATKKKATKKTATKKKATAKKTATKKSTTKKAAAKKPAAKKKATAKKPAAKKTATKKSTTKKPKE